MPPARTLTPWPPLPTPSLPPLPGEGENRDEKDSKDTNDSTFCFSPSSPGVVGREGAGEEGRGGEGRAGGRRRWLILFALVLGCAGDVRGGPTPASAPVRSGQITLLVSPGDQNRPELVRLAAGLDRAVSEMA